MLLRVVQFFLLIFLISCSTDENTQLNSTTIEDSYFFQKDTYNMSLYKCEKPQLDVGNLRVSETFQELLYTSTISPSTLDIEGCATEDLIINELTPAIEVSFDQAFLIDISYCKTTKDEFDLNKDFTNFLTISADLDQSPWHGVSNVEDNNFVWINVFDDYEHRENLLLQWSNSNESGIIAKEFQALGKCSVPELYYFP